MREIPLLFQSMQCLNIGLGISSRGDHQVVTTKFTLRSDLARNPPDGRMEEQKPLDRVLNQVDQVVAADNVREFVK